MHFKEEIMINTIIRSVVIATVISVIHSEIIGAITGEKGILRKGYARFKEEKAKADAKA
jgi:hypothetical protein